MKTVAAHFATFAQAVIPPTPSPHQREDMRMAFFAGATSMLTLMTVMATESGESDDVGATRIAALHQEMRDFAKSLAGVAR